MVKSQLKSDECKGRLVPAFIVHLINLFAPWKAITTMKINYKIAKFVKNQWKSMFHSFFTIDSRQMYNKISKFWNESKRFNFLPQNQLSHWPTIQIQIKAIGINIEKWIIYSSK